ncbi:MAG: hypothetical protein Q8P03_00170, partial [bacterium]|nr:hypothetical protein [bacterium]
MKRPWMVLAVSAFLAFALIPSPKESASAQEAQTFPWVKLNSVRPGSIVLGEWVTVATGARWNLGNKNPETGSIVIELSSPIRPENIVLVSQYSASGFSLSVEGNKVTGTKSPWSNSPIHAFTVKVRPESTGTLSFQVSAEFWKEGVQYRVSDPRQLQVMVVDAPSSPVPVPIPTPTSTPPPTPVDKPPVITLPRAKQIFRVHRGEKIVVQIKAYDPEGQQLAHSLSEQPLGMEISGTGLVTWDVPDTGAFAAGQKVTVSVEVSDNASSFSKGKIARRTFIIEVLAAKIPTPTST